jgi:hypothetical protein
MSKERDDVNKTETRRGFLRTGLGIVAAGGVATVARAQDAEKLAQNIVQYQESPKDGAMCSTCVNFVAPNACKIVAGTINPNGWCVAYAPKGS